MKVDIENKIKEAHEGDEKQLEFIFSKEKRILVEAAAGYGKTKSMISKVAYLIASKQIPNPKKILALTFSVNASYKIKKEVIQQIPFLLNSTKPQNRNINKAIYVSNFHGFCRRILRIHGHLLHTNLKNIDNFISFGDDNEKKLANEGYSDTDIEMMTMFNSSVKNAQANFVCDKLEAYNQIILDSCIPSSKISYNAIISLTIQLFQQNEELLKFYQKYFPIIMVDEFQDTNELSLYLLRLLISNDNVTFYLIGDSLQRIYGFIGAVPNLMSFMENDYNMTRIEYTQNYRFKNNPKMLLLDKNIRLNAKVFNNPNITEDVTVNFDLSDTQQEEANYVVKKVRQLKKLDEKAKIVVLFRNGANTANTQKILEEFQNQKEPFFYGLFSDDDAEYIRFHKKCSEVFSSLVKGKNFTQKLLRKLNASMEEEYKDSNSPVVRSLLILLNAFIDKFIKDEMFALEDEDKKWYIMETLDNFALKQSLEHVDAQVSIFTIHASKGLEWDYVIVPDCENYSLPSFNICDKKCNFEKHTNCSLYNVDEELAQSFSEELSTFYVAFTRAKKDVFFSASKKGVNRKGEEKSRNITCLLQQKGIKLSEID